VLEGARSICAEAGIHLAGGHSIDSPEPIFGLAVTGLVNIIDLKQNNTATAGSELFLTKPLGVGILTTAQKKGILRDEDAAIAPAQMMQLNKIGAELSKLDAVTALTDVTGFGLLGHLSEVCEGSGLTAEIEFSKVPRLAAAEPYVQQGSVPGGTGRNWASYGHKVGPISDEQRTWLCDPQTSGGLLVCVAPQGREAVLEVFAKHRLALESFGHLRAHKEGEAWVQVGA
jgi:selenide,water dikinase